MAHKANLHPQIVQSAWVTPTSALVSTPTAHVTDALQMTPWSVWCGCSLAIC
jgi:hypothetical protein